MATETEATVLTSSNENSFSDDGANVGAGTPAAEVGSEPAVQVHSEEPTTALSGSPETLTATAPNSTKCQFLPHGMYAVAPAMLSIFAWFAFLSKDGCHYAKVTGPIVADITNNPLTPSIFAGLTHYREPSYDKVVGEWYYDETLPCKAYNTDLVDVDEAWTFAKIASFLSFLFGGGGAMFIFFASCFVFRKETWRWAGYEMVVATITGGLSFTWFATSLCHGNGGQDRCSLEYGAYVDIIACVCWALSGVFIFCHYPAETKSLQGNGPQQSPPAQVFEMTDQSEGRRAGAATDGHEII